MSERYPGPLRDEPLAIELHNTVYAERGHLVDGLHDAAAVRAFLDALGPRLPAGLPAGPAPSVRALGALRLAVRSVLRSAVDGAPYDRGALAVLNEAAGRAPVSVGVVLDPDGRPERRSAHRGASRADVVLATLAADAIDLVTGPHRDELRACGAPGCVLLYLRGHPRRSWCCNACGNRARQARHYRRTHPHPA